MGLGSLQMVFFFLLFLQKCFLMKKILFLFSLFVLATLSEAEGQDQNISNSGFPDTEPFLAVNPANQNNLIAAWMHFTVAQKEVIYVKSSFDGGVTWGNQTSLPHFSPTFTSADVSIAFNSAGEAFLSYVDYHNIAPVPDSGYVRVARSLDGGKTWSAPVNAVSGKASADLPVDRPWIICDQSNSAYKGKIYLVSKSYYAATPPQKVWLSVSADSGKTFSPIKQLDDSIPNGLTNIMGTPTVGADGSLYVAYASYKPSLSPYARMIVTKSTDGGNTFIPYDAMHYASNSTCSDTLYQGSYNVSANPTQAGNLVLQWTDCRNGDMDILSCYSTDGGITWSSPIRVNDDLPIGNGYGQDMSWGAFSSSGIYAVTWRDRRNYLTNDTSAFDMYSAFSTTVGNGFFPGNIHVNGQSSPFINIQRGNDFIGVAVTGNYILSDWCDQRTGNTEIFFTKFDYSQVISTNDIAMTDFKFEIFPNPATKGNINYKIDAANFESAEIKITDAQGKEVFSRKIFSEQGTLNANLPAGNYFVKLFCSGKTYSQKLEITNR